MVWKIEQAPSLGLFCHECLLCCKLRWLTAALRSDLLGLVSWCRVPRCAGGGKKNSRQDRKEEEVHMPAPERVRQNTGALPLQACVRLAAGTPLLRLVFSNRIGSQDSGEAAGLNAGAAVTAGIALPSVCVELQPLVFCTHDKTISRPWNGPKALATLTG